MKEVRELRDALIAKYGGDRIEPDVEALVEEAVHAATVTKLCALYIRRAGILRGDSLRAGNL